MAEVGGEPCVATGIGTKTRGVSSHPAEAGVLHKDVPAVAPRAEGVLVTRKFRRSGPREGAGRDGRGLLLRGCCGRERLLLLGGFVVVVVGIGFVAAALDGRRVEARLDEII